MQSRDSTGSEKEIKVKISAQTVFPNMCSHAMGYNAYGKIGKVSLRGTELKVLTVIFIYCNAYYVYIYTHVDMYI